MTGPPNYHIVKYLLLGNALKHFSPICQSMSMNTYSYTKVGQTQFQLKEEYVCGTKYCTLKAKHLRCKNYTTLQLYFVLKSNSTLLIRRYTLLFPYYNPHDWFDLIFKEVHINESNDIAIKRQLPDSHAFSTEIAEICEEKHVMRTSNYLGEGTFTWGQVTKDLKFPTRDVYRYFFFASQ